MNIEDFREFCLSLNEEVEECFPFDLETLVFKINNKMFALTDLCSDFRINLKCNPETAIELRETYSSVVEGYHMNKKHWNTIIIDGSVPDKLIYEWIKHSFQLVSKKKQKNNF